MSRDVGIGSYSEVAIDPHYLGLGINPFAIRDGVLAIEVRPADARVQAAIKNAMPSGYSGPRDVPKFTAGVLTTQFSFQQTYGYFEIRMKVPHFMGGTPAFWLLGPPGTYDEIDVAEILTGQPDILHVGHQWGRIGPDAKNSERADIPGDDLSNAFHVFGVLWTASEIVYYRDNLEIARFANKGLHRPMYLIVSIGTDGEWNKRENMAAAANASGDLLVDYVRAYALGTPR